MPRVNLELKEALKVSLPDDTPEANYLRQLFAIAPQNRSNLDYIIINELRFRVMGPAANNLEEAA